eukprot:jgi/Botrbrau1/22268/Bobra.0138s0028.1
MPSRSIVISSGRCFYSRILQVFQELACTLIFDFASFFRDIGGFHVQVFTELCGALLLSEWRRKFTIARPSAVVGSR